ncbi:MAG TPA: portal protein, partial [Candidatus Paceibacterota bacterium]
EDEMSFNKEIITAPIENHLAVRWDLTCKKFDTSDKQWATISSVISKRDYEAKYGEEHPIGQILPKGDEYAGWFLEHGYRIAEYWKVIYKDTPICLLSDGRVVLKSEAPSIIARAMAYLTQGGPMLRVVDERITKIPTVTSAIVSGTEILEGPFEWPGRYIPVVIAFGKRMNLNGKMRLKSLVRDAKESQRMHNGLISAMTQSVIMQQTAPYVGTTEQFKGKREEWVAAQEGNVPFVTYNPDPQAPGSPQRQLPSQTSTGYSELLMFNSKTRMDIIGIHEAGLGMRSNEQSGIAIQQRQKEGDTGTFVFIDNFRHALTFDGRIKIDLIPKIYDTPRMMRILGNDNKEEFVQLYEESMDRNGQPVLKANPKVGKYDIHVTTGPSYTTQRQEQQAAMVQMLQAVGANSPIAAVILPGIIRAMDWKDGDKIAEAIISQLPQNVQQILNDDGKGNEDPKMQQLHAAMAQQVQQMQMQMEQAMQVAQQNMAQLQQENQTLKAGHLSKMADIQSRRDMHEADKQLEREKIMAEMTMQEKELELKKNLAIEEMKAKMTIELTIFAEKMKMEKQAIKEGAATEIKESAGA